MSGIVYCGCGHTADEHTPAGCRHVNRPSKRFPTPAPCECTRLAPDPRLPDGDAFSAKVLQKVIAKEGIPMEPVEWDDAVQVLRIALWKTAVKYDSRSHVRFRVYAYLELYNDAIDHFRAERGRHGQHRVHDPGPGLLVGDEPVDTDRLDGTASRDPADDPDNWATDAGGLLQGGDGGQAGLAGQPRNSGSHGDARRDPRPVRSDGRRPRAEAA